MNKPQPGLTPFTAAARPYPQFVSGTFFRSDGEARYNAMTFEVQRKVGQITFDSHFTWASNYNNYDSSQNFENPYAPRPFGHDQYTPRRRFVMNAVWQIPAGKGRRYLADAPAIVDHILGGWQLYWIGYLQSGFFFTPSFTGSDPSNTNTIGGRPDRNCNGNLPSSQRNVNHWFDSSCFAVPRQGRFGNAGSNILEGPGYNMQDISISKTFSLTERFKFTLTGAAANAFNHPNFLIPSANISAPGSVGIVGGVVEGASARQIEVRGRIDF